MAENFDVGHAAPAALTGFAFESAVLEMFRRIRGIDVSTTGSRHDGGVDLIIADGTPIGIPGPVNVQVKFVKRGELA
ncbi:restriction endonuclease [Azospirillum argentinense]|uniref:Restriction endonuclease type IV Mrr domain-containing protein n=1 Tax=Azospirillum brasilense TaxID=192 RepID=A0A4D8Q6E8_AZOBR|nr:hypothetical protein D3867_14480 [Azospirillum argentinense]